MKYSIFFFLLLSFVSLHGESPVIKHFSSNDGLVSNKVHCTVQDSTGFMWIGTENGLSRYDGYSFLSFSLSSGDSLALPSDNILCLAVDPVSKFLWIGTTKGLCYFNHYTFDFHTDFLTPNGDTNLTTKEISSLFFDKSGKLWVSTPSGAYYFNDTNSPPIVINNENYTNLASNDINCIYEDSKNAIWIGSSMGLNIYNKQTDEVIHTPNLQGITSLFSIYEDSENNMWFSTQSNGLYKYNNTGKLIHYTKEDHSLSSNYCTGTIENEKGNILASVRDGKGLHLMQKGTSHFSTIEPDIYNPNSLKSTTLNSIYKDNFGNIWISSWNGIHFIDKNDKKFNHYKINYRKDGLISNSVRSFFQDSDGDIWIGTRDGGCLSKFEPKTGTFVNFKHDKNIPYSLSDTYVLSICEAEKDILLIGTFSGGLNLFYKKTGKFEKHNTLFSRSLNSGAVFKVFKDRYGTIWVGLSNELYTFNLQTKQFTLVPGLYEIRDFLDYDENYLYMVSASKGAYRYSYKKGAFESYNLQNNMFPSNTLTSINSDDNKNIWVTSYDAGLIKLDPINNATKTYQAKDGLSNNLTTAVLIDNQGKLWISTSNGISKFDTINMSFKKYDVIDGLQGNEFEKGVAYKLNTGEMLFGGINGFNYFHPDSIIHNLVPPHIVITDFRLFNKKVGVGQPGSPLTKHISETKDITLTHNQSVITFEFTAINFSTPEKNQYAYKLENFDKDWNYVATTRTANYTTLPPGEYVFRVIASNNDGTWNTQGVALNITILPPWWATWWFRGLVILFVISLTFGYHWYQIRNLIHQKQVLKQKVKERTSDLEKANQELGEQKEQILKQNNILYKQTEDLKLVNRILEEKNYLIEEQNEEILVQRDNLLELNEKIEQASQYKLQFFTNISHEFRTPLTLISGPIEKILSEWEPNKEIKKLLLIIKKNSYRLKNLINELMDFREIESKQAKLKLSNGDIVKFVTEIAETFFDLAKHQNIKLNIKSRDNSIETCFDFAKMEKILYNLISNAFKYTKTNGSIEIDVYQQKRGSQNTDINNSVTLGEFLPDKDYVVITVKDTGIGIEETYLSDIFIRFTRLKTAEFIQGTGIGLALTKDLVEMHNGTISVSSKIGDGSIFSVRIPIISNTGSCDNDTSDYQMNFSWDNIPLLTENIIAGDIEPVYIEKIKNGKKILIVEDNNDLRYFIAQQFTSKYNVIEASNGNEGLKLAQVHLPDIIICDILMPGLSGIDLCKRLKTDLYTCHIPFIFLTALAEIENQMTGLESRADDYISKPFEPAILELKVRNIIESRQKLKSIYSASDNPKASDITTNSRDEQFLQKAIDIVNENLLKSDFCITDFHEAMGVSRSLLHKKLISLTGHSATDFIISIRLKKALNLLKNKDLNISEISYMVGFNTPKYFSRCFRKYYGKNPTQYYDETS